MLILLHLDPADISAEKAYRLQVKDRIFRFNHVRLDHIYIIVMTSMIAIGHPYPHRQRGEAREA